MIKRNRCGLHRVDMELNTIFKILHTIDINKMLVYRAIERYNESSVCGRKRYGRLRSISTKKALNALKERIRRNHYPKAKKNISGDSNST